MAKPTMVTFTQVSGWLSAHEVISVPVAQIQSITAVDPVAAATLPNQSIARAGAIVQMRGKDGERYYTVETRERIVQLIEGSN